MKEKVLFICVHNSARSQMAEEYLRKFSGDLFDVESAGYEPTKINPLVVEVMKEEGVDLSNKKTQNVYELIKNAKLFGYIITVCRRDAEDECPVYPGMAKRLHWDLENPEEYVGTEEEKLEKLRDLRDKIKMLVLDFIANEHK
jgi:arsenate reductase